MPERTADMRSGTSPYTVIRRLGSGGMADVFLARDTSLGGRLVALKRVRGAHPDLLVHFNREARAGALLVHPNIVRVEDSGQDAEGPYIALEFVDGVSASTLLRFYAHLRMALPVEQWSVLARDVAAGLHHAHSISVKNDVQGVLHRDLSPDNVLISIEGVAKLSDFGLAYIPGDTRLTRTGSVRGKVTYLAPELFEGGNPSPATDIYGLGVVLFRLATGMAPFRGNNDGELILNILHGQRPVLSALRPDLPGPVAAWVQQAISRQPNERPSLATLLELLPAYEPGGAARASLSQVVLTARDQASPVPPASLNLEQQTQRVVPAMPEPPKANAEPTERVSQTLPVPLEQNVAPTERVPSARPSPASSAESTERVLPALPEPRPVFEPSTDRALPALPEPQPLFEPSTERAVPALAEPKKAQADLTERILSSLPEPRRTKDEPTTRVRPPLAEPKRAKDDPTLRIPRAQPRTVHPAEDRTPLAVGAASSLPRRRPWRRAAWLIVGALVLGVIGVLLISRG
jgi:serine/threonine protein kinase